LNLGSREDDGLMQELLLAALKAEAHFKPGAVSLQSYIFPCLRYAPASACLDPGAV